MVFEKNILMIFVYLFISQYLTTIVAQPIPCGPNLFTENMNQNTKKICFKKVPGVWLIFIEVLENANKFSMILMCPLERGHVPSFYQT